MNGDSRIAGANQADDSVKLSGSAPATPAWTRPNSNSYPKRRHTALDAERHADPYAYAISDPERHFIALGFAIGRTFTITDTHTVETQPTHLLASLSSSPRGFTVWCWRATVANTPLTTIQQFVRLLP